MVEITQGKLLPNIIRFAIPIALSNILQISFNAADVAVVGIFCGSNSVASIGATTSLIHLLINLFMGLATGTTIAISQSLGAQKYDDVSKYTHTAVTVSALSGVVVAIIALFVARPVLTLLGTPEGEILDGAVKYFRIYFLGAPAVLLYNFCSGILKANGDSKRPFIYLTIGGIANVILNVFLVVIFNMDVDGVAIATVVSNVIAATLTLICLKNSDGPSRVVFSQLKIYKDKFLTILKHGLPAGIQNCMFSIPNVMIQSSINTFGAAAIAGNTAASNINSYLDISSISFSEATLTFVSRNYGAKNYKRVWKVCKICLLGAAVLSIFLGSVSFIFKKPLLSLFVPGDPQAIYYGTIRLIYIALPHFLGSGMSVLNAAVRGLGKPLYPMVSSIFGVCVVRILWLLTVFRIYPTIHCVFFTYPFTWAITCILLGGYLIYLKRKIMDSEIVLKYKEGVVV